MKRSWLEKMCNTIPAVLLLCIDWTVDLSQPQEARSKLQTCFKKVAFQFGSYVRSIYMIY